MSRMTGVVEIELKFCIRDDVYDGEDGEDEQAAVGRLSSMSLMAAVTASGESARVLLVLYPSEINSRRSGRGHSTRFC